MQGCHPVAAAPTRPRTYSVASTIRTGGQGGVGVSGLIPYLPGSLYKKSTSRATIVGASIVPPELSNTESRPYSQVLVIAGREPALFWGRSVCSCASRYLRG